jgi:cell division protein ZapB
MVAPGASGDRPRDLFDRVRKLYHWLEFPPNPAGMSTDELRRALDRIEAAMSSLQSRVDELEREKHSLLERQEALVAERAGLVQRNEEARTRVESMIERLKALESAG